MTRDKNTSIVAFTNGQRGVVIVLPARAGCRPSTSSVSHIAELAEKLVDLSRSRASIHAFARSRYLIHSSSYAISPSKSISNN